jgi:predicted nucleotidyltransferase
MGLPLALTASQLKIVNEIVSRVVPQREVWAFGSRARFTEKPFSDLDLAVMGEPPLTLSEMAELSEAFSNSDLPFKVDVVDWATCSEPFRQVIRDHHVVLA